MPVRIRLLGGLALETHDGRPVALPTRKAAGLLAVLATRPGAAHARERLAAMLWPQSGEAQARGSLRQALAQARKALSDAGGDAGLVEARRDGVRLASPAGGLDVDVARLEAALGDGSTERLEEAARLYTGDLLEGFGVDEEPFEQWRRAEAARLRFGTLAALGRLLAAYVEGGDADAGIALGERLLALDPAGEETHRALMRAHLARGALGAAMRQYERCLAALRSELGVPPSAETEALRRRIRAAPRPGPAEPSSTPMVAVLPFANLSDDPGQVYFARGFADEVLRELSRFRSLGVIARQSSFAVDPQLPPADLGGRLGARYLLSGSVRKPPGAAGRVRIGAELVDAETGRYLWTHRYDAEAGSLFEAEDDIVRAVVAALALRIGEAELGRARRRPPADLDAYDLWLRGFECLRRGTPDSDGEARALFQRALDADPGFARAHAGLSLAHFNDWSCQAWQRWDENERGAFDHASQAVALDDADHFTHFILGRILIYRRDFDRGEWHLDRAEALNPNDADVLVQTAMGRAYLGQAERGIDAARAAMRLNPFHDDWYCAYAAVPHFVARRLEEAIPLARRAPDAGVDVPAFLAAACARLGRLDEAARHREAFLHAFRTKITFGREPRPDEPARWVLHVNPFKRAEDRDYLLAGLDRAGLPLPANP